MFLKINTITGRFFSLRTPLLAAGMTILLSTPVCAQGYGRYISNSPMGAGSNASLEEVWMKHGGARLQFDALMGPIQVNTNGRPWRDPAMVNYLPPLFPKKRGARPHAPTVREPKRPDPAAASTMPPNSSPRPAIAPQPAATAPIKPLEPALQTSENTSGSGSLGSPYSGPAPTTPEAAQNGDALSTTPQASPKVNQDPFHYH